jgi:hypothetical protein
MPQLLLSVCVLVQPPVVAQYVSPIVVHVQTPALQVAPVAQTLPHMPQLLLSVCVLVQALLHTTPLFGHFWH